MNRDSVSALLLGLGIGTVIGLLAAPRSGEKTRARIIGKVRESSDYAKDQASSLRSSASDFLEKGMQDLERRRAGVAEAIEAGRHAYRKAIAA